VMKRAIEKYDVDVVGLTLSKNQRAYCQQLLDEVDSKPLAPGSCCGIGQTSASRWNRIVTIEALEHFRFRAL